MPLADAVTKNTQPKEFATYVNELSWTVLPLILMQNMHEKVQIEQKIWVESL